MRQVNDKAGCVSINLSIYLSMYLIFPQSHSPQHLPNRAFSDALLPASVAQGSVHLQL